MKTMTIGLFALAAVIAVLAFVITSISGGDDDGGLTPAEQRSTQTAQAKTPTVARTTPGTTTPGTPGTTASGTARATASGTPGAGGRTYTVKSGDTCGAIAAANNTTVEEIRRLNPSIDRKSVV